MENPVPKGLNTFIGKNEIPRELPAWRASIEDNQNPALAVRWAAAMAEIEKTFEFDEITRKAATSDWRKSVIEHVGQYKNLSYFDAAEDTDSIVSVRVKHPDTGEWMIKSELSKVFKAMTLDMTDKLKSGSEEER